MKRSIVLFITVLLVGCTKSSEDAPQPSSAEMQSRQPKSTQATARNPQMKDWDGDSGGK